MEIAAAPFENLLKERFQLPAFRRGQREILADVIAKRDVLAVLPTGGGKSLCFQFPAVHTGQLVVVVSPLIALMKDQVSALERMKIPAGCLHSGQTEEEKRTVFRRMEAGGTFLLYLSPERVQKEGFRRWIEKRKVALFAIDEAHCISQWGHDFREEYGQLELLKKIRPDVPILALTASATPLVLRDIARRLGLESPRRHVHGFYRPNLYYQVESGEDEETKLRLLAQAIAQNPSGRIIVYAGTRRSVEEISETLAKQFANVDYYHAGLSSLNRTQAQEAFARGETRVLVATNAFGMGIDQADVRLVVHFHMPANIDALYQEMGRAGRDGLPSTCLMLYARKDKGLQSYFITKSDAPADIKRSRWNTLEAIVNYAEGGECRHAGILTYYQDSQRIESCGHCDTCDPQSPLRIERPKAGARMAAVTKGNAPTRASRKKEAKKAAVAAEESFDEAQKDRLAALKDWRKCKAKELDVAAFMVFSDRTLRHLAELKPTSREGLRAVHGIGETKLEAFGTDLLEVFASLA